MMEKTKHTQKAFLVAMLLAGFALTLSCKGPPSSGRKNWKSADSEGTDDTRPVSGDTETPDQPTPLELLPNAGSKLRFLNGRALTEVYSRVFSPDDAGYAHCQKEKPRDYTGCSVMFAAEERPSMGFFDLYSERMSRGIQNAQLPENLTLNYMRNLRAAVGRECNRLVTNEEKAANPATALIVKVGGPTSASLEVFFRKILGIEGTAIPVDIPFADYVNAHKAAVAMDTDKAKAQHNADVNLCITLAMDPQVFLY